MSGSQVQCTVMWKRLPSGMLVEIQYEQSSTSKPMSQQEFTIFVQDISYLTRWLGVEGRPITLLISRTVLERHNLISW